ncbi:hypothetical protein PDIG_67330 [Penicillium digitatum PHI26]|uniref:Uncharacterized protein n=3 Tax=Penicillium digitatum TaxID=36651 RepID=K9FI18_PEND2|nr:hypothetical protein PDIP_76630 [Penicillium digitatum Pd1]EKV06842.1 hypothetical protein PDIP_76630 [Penicillium digitatum Pd1]EKV08869.1 hypothetical protein PDIG_67330 [Penicillium digitatum PHI26]
MADPYGTYNSHSTSAPSGFGYYPPEDQPAHGHHQPYGNQGSYYSSGSEQHNPGSEPYLPYPNPTQPYSPQQSSYHLAPKQSESAMERSYTPTGQPDYLGPVTPTGYEHAQDRIPANADY